MTTEESNVVADRDKAIMRRIGLGLWGYNTSAEGIIAKLSEGPLPPDGLRKKVYHDRSHSEFVIAFIKSHGDDTLIYKHGIAERRAEAVWNRGDDVRDWCLAENREALESALQSFASHLREPAMGDADAGRPVGLD